MAAPPARHHRMNAPSTATMQAFDDLAARTVVCMTTHDRVDCARINQEVVKLNYGHPLRIVHACSDPLYEPYLEDLLVRCEPKPLKEGALNLLRNAVEHAIDAFAPQFIVHLEADTWLLREAVLFRYIDALAADESKVLAASTWSEDTLDWRDCTGRARPTGSGPVARVAHAAARALRGMGYGVGLANTGTYATQFFVLRNRRDVVGAVLGMRAVRGSGLEASLYRALHGGFSTDQVLPMPEREPVAPLHRYWCDALDLCCQHWPAAGTAADPRPPSNPLHVPSAAPGKRESLLRRSSSWRGEHLNRLLAAQDLGYYNAGAKRY
ncbi:MAG: hypothetical protein HYZ20_02975 [Burkholderiales bacterium]|nr:hypothetical protein [Burkholderiales bacterium]